MRAFGGWATSSISLFILGLVAAAGAGGCTGDQFRAGQSPAQGGAGGGAGSAGAAGKATAGAGGALAGAGGGGAGAGGGGAGASAGSAGTTAAGASGATAAGSAGASGSGAGGGSAGAGGGGTAGAAGKAGSGAAAGQGGAGGNAGGGGSAPVEIAPTVESATLFASSCTGDAYATGLPLEAVQGAGELCLQITGKLKAGDTLSIDGVATPYTLDAAGSKLTAKWTVTHGGGLVDRPVPVVLARGSLTAAPVSVVVVPRRVSSDASVVLPELGTTASPYRSLEAALATTDPGDGVVIQKLPKITDPNGNKAPLRIPKGVTVGRLGAGPVTIVLERPLALADDASLVGLTLDATGGSAPNIAVRIEGKGIVLNDLIVDAHPNIAVGFELNGAAATIVGGRLTGRTGIAAFQSGAKIKVKGTSFVVVDPNGKGIDVLDAGGGDHELDVEAGAEPTKFTSAGSYIAVSGAARVALAGMVGTGGKEGLYLVAQKVDIGNVKITGATVGATFSSIPNLVIDGLVVEKPTKTGVRLENGTAGAQIKSLEVLDPGETGVSLQSAADVPGKLRVAWSVDGVGEPSFTIAGISVSGGKLTGKGLIRVERSPGRGIYLLNSTLESTPADAASGVKIVANRGSCLQVQAQSSVTADDALFGQPAAGGTRLVETSTGNQALSVKLRKPTFDGSGLLEPTPTTSFTPAPEQFVAPGGGEELVIRRTFAGKERIVLWMFATQNAAAHTAEFL